MPLKKFSYFVQRNRIDLFEENSTGTFDAKIYSNISIKFALKKVCLNDFCSVKVFLILLFYSFLLDPRINGYNAIIYWSSSINTSTLWISGNSLSPFWLIRNDNSFTAWPNKKVEHFKPYAKNNWSGKWLDLRAWLTLETSLDLMPLFKISVDLRVEGLVSNVNYLENRRHNFVQNKCGRKRRLPRTHVSFSWL